jgi:mevalonate kinase
MTTTFAPAKLILFGEHAVVYGKHGIAVPINDLQTKISIKKSDDTSYKIDRILNENQKEKLDELIDFISKKLKKNFHLIINSSVPISQGFGSSASISVAILNAINEEFDLKYSRKKINELAYSCEKIFHGNPSGIDNTVITYHKPLFFNKNDNEFFKIKTELNLIIVNTGKRPHTKDTIEFVKNNYKLNTKRYDLIMDEINNVSINAKDALENGDIKTLGKLMNKNHRLLQKMKLNTPKIDLFCELCLANGALGAKLSGAGKGGNMIALVSNETKDKIISELNFLTDEIHCVKIK